MSLTTEAQKTLRARQAEIKAETRALESEADAIGKALALLDAQAHRSGQTQAPPETDREARDRALAAKKPKKAKIDRADRVPIGPDIDRVLRVLRENKRPMKRFELRDALGIGDSRITAILQRAVQDDRVQRIEGRSVRDNLYVPVDLPATQLPGYRPPIASTSANGDRAEPVSAGSGFGRPV